MDAVVEGGSGGRAAANAAAVVVVGVVGLTAGSLRGGLAL